MWYTSMSMNSGRYITYTNTSNSHSNPVSWELLLFSIKDKKIRMHKVLMEMLRGCGVNLKVWMILEKKKKEPEWKTGNGRGDRNGVQYLR